MKEYIEKEKAVGIAHGYCHTTDGRCCGPDDVVELYEELKAIPAADVVEVRKAKWVATDKYMVDKCSNCQFEMDWDDVPLWLVDMPHFKDSCPNCGAKMDGGVNGAAD